MSDSFEPLPVVYSPPSYPLIAFLVQWGTLAAYVVGVLPLIGTAVAVSVGYSAWWVAAGAVGSAVITVLLLSYAELLRVIDDMLLPK